MTYDIKADAVSRTQKEFVFGGRGGGHEQWTVKSEDAGITLEGYTDNELNLKQVRQVVSGWTRWPLERSLWNTLLVALQVCK